jgi:hypothetical protein
MIACLAAFGVATRLPAQATQESKEQKAELRFFVLDKNGSPVDIKNWTGAAEVTPEHGTAKTIKLDQAQPMFGKEHTKAAEPEPERYSNSQSYGADGAKAESQAGWTKDRMLCGEARKLDDGWVEMIVVTPKMKSMMQQGKQAYEEGKEAVQGKGHDGFMHDHGAAYFKAPFDPAWVLDPKTNTINFTARVTFTNPAGDTKYVKGFTYPAGFVNGAITHLIDKDFNDTSKFDHDQATRAAHKVNWCLAGLPPLSFSNDKDRQEYEKARQDTMACTKHLEQATGKDVEKAADECKSALKEVRSQAGDAQGVLYSQ